VFKWLAILSTVLAVLSVIGLAVATSALSELPPSFVVSALLCWGTGIILSATIAAIVYIAEKSKSGPPREVQE
jgi:hypothetical protein